jgi:hypothetical protein
VTPSAVRNMGSPGVVHAAREFLTHKVSLKEMALSGERFSGLLDLRTDQLVKAFPKPARHWGTARKVLNIFLRDATYNSFLCQAFRLDQLSKRLEVPVDRDVAEFLRNDTSIDGQKRLLRWISIKSLNREQNKEYQDAAKLIAAREGIEPVDIDVLAWRKMSATRKSNQ